jgi:hypothetical protein
VLTKGDATMNYSTNYFHYDDPEPCPYCGAGCHAEFVDVGVGMAQCGPYRCENCHAYELKDGYNGDSATWTDKERETGWREPSQEPQITCIGCHKTPNELDEYIESSAVEEMTPTMYVMSEEGTFNKFLQGKFYCTPCYVEAGQPNYLTKERI